MNHRIRCCIPHCRRTTAAEKIAPFREWLCSDHWRLVPKRLKQVRRRMKWRFKHRPTETARRIEWRSWDLCKAAVMKEMGGIG